MTPRMAVCVETVQTMPDQCGRRRLKRQIGSLSVNRRMHGSKEPPNLTSEHQEVCDQSVELFGAQFLASQLLRSVMAGEHILQ